MDEVREAIAVAIFGRGLALSTGEVRGHRFWSPQNPVYRAAFLDADAVLEALQNLPDSVIEEAARLLMQAHGEFEALGFPRTGNLDALGPHGRAYAVNKTAQILKTLFGGEQS